MTVHVSEGNGGKRKRISLSYFLGRTNRRQLSLSLSVGNRLLRGLCIFGNFLFLSSSLLSLTLSFSSSLSSSPARLSLSLSHLDGNFRREERFLFLSHLSLFRKLFPSFSFTFKGFMVLSVVDTNMEKVQDPLAKPRNSYQKHLSAESTR